MFALAADTDTQTDFMYHQQERVIIGIIQVYITVHLSTPNSRGT
jgi:hypothetical protein